ncbi:MAG: hypothetical protein ACI9SP_000861 [Arenicella sp.]|jgi:hypothetical protein
MKKIVEPFMYPNDDEHSDSVINQIANAYSKAVFDRVINNASSLVDLDIFFSDYQTIQKNGPGNGMKGWRPEMGLSLAYLRKGESLSALGQMLAGLNDELISPDWSLSFSKSQPDILYNSKVYRRCTGMSRSTTGSIIIDALGGIVESRVRPITLVAGAKKTYQDDTNHNQNLYILTVTGEMGEHSESIWPLTKVIDSDLDYSVFIASLDDAFELIRSYAPEYYQWVKRATKGLCIFRKDDGTGIFNSASSSVNPGIITVSMPISVLSLAETLVHEATHQYFLLLDYCFPFHDGSDDKLYYSPVRHQDRPLGLILLAFHAVANMALFYKKMMKCDEHESLSTIYYNEKREAALGLSQGLNATPALTQSGIVLRDSLVERLEI